MRGASPIVIAILGAGCYAAAPAPGAPCGANEVCPTGLTCQGGLCEYPGTTLDAPGTAPGDAVGPAPDTADPGPHVPIAFVQGAYQTPQTPQSIVKVDLTDRQRPHSLNVVFAAWFYPPASITSVTDSHGNSYTPAFTAVSAGTIKLVAYYATNIAGGAANTIRVQFDQPVPFPDVRVVEYEGLATTAVLQAAVHDSQQSGMCDSGAITTTQANELVVAGNVVTSSITTSAGTGFTRRIITMPNGHILEDTVLASPASVHASAPLQISSPWIMAALAFRAAAP